MTEEEWQQFLDWWELKWPLIVPDRLSVEYFLTWRQVHDVVIHILKKEKRKCRRK